MTDDGTITNEMLFDHIQAGRRETREFKKDLQKQIVRLEQKMDQGFREAKEQREEIREDLEATIKMQAGHDRELAVLTGRPMPEDY